MAGRSTEQYADTVAQKAFLEIAIAADEFEQYRNPHASRIAKIADVIAREFHMAPQDRASLRAAALMHDLGEVAMERDYIERAGPLTDDEKLDLARHPVIGEQECARAGAHRPIQLLVRWHHEWWNGFGYPDALRGKEIPLGARIIRIADTYAALTDARPYRAALDPEEARERIIEGGAIEFDPKVVQVFLNLSPFDDLQSKASQTFDLPGPSESLFSSFSK